MSNLTIFREILKFNNSVLVQKSFTSYYSNFSLNLCIVYELNGWPSNPANTVLPKNIYLVRFN